MNPDEQKRHTKKTAELEQAIVDLGTVVYDRLDKAVHTLEGRISTTVSEERNRRMDALTTQRRWVENEHERFTDILRELEGKLTEARNELVLFKSRPFLKRLSWVFLGQ